MADMNCETAREIIDAFIDGDLDEPGRAALRRHCDQCGACGRELVLAERVRDELRALPALSAPHRLIRDAGAAARVAPVVPLPVRTRRVRPRPAIVGVMAAALAVAAATVWLATRRSGDTPAPAYTEAEVRRARDEMALAFAYVGRYSAESAEILRDDVMARRVMPRIERALVTSGESAFHDALVPGLKRAVRESGLDVTSPPPTRS